MQIKYYKYFVGENVKCKNVASRSNVISQCFRNVRRQLIFAINNYFRLEVPEVEKSSYVLI